MRIPAWEERDSVRRIEVVDVQPIPVDPEPCVSLGHRLREVGDRRDRSVGETFLRGVSSDDHGPVDGEADPVGEYDHPFGERLLDVVLRLALVWVPLLLWLLR